MAKVHLAYDDNDHTPSPGEMFIVVSGGVVEPVAASGGGVTDHGALTGLGDDDHTQYLNTTRHAAIDAADHGSGAATDGYVLTADGAGGAAWEPAQAGAAALDDLTDVTITTPTTGDLVRYNGSAWVNYPDSNYAQSTHAHIATDITDFTESVQDVVGGMVTGNTETDIDVTYDDGTGKLNFVVTAVGGATALNGLSDVTITTPADNEVLAYDSGSSEWINQTAAEAGLATSGHNHDAAYVNVSGDTMSGALTFASNGNGVPSHQINFDALDSGGAGIGIAVYGRYNTVGELVITAPLTVLNGDLQVSGTTGTINGSTILTAANSAETISDQVGAMVTGNTETGIAVTYDDADNTLDFILAYDATVPASLTPDIAGATGVSDAPARRDHVHNIPAAAPTTSLSATSTNAEGNGTSFARNNHTHAISVTGTPSTILPDASASVGVSSSLSRVDHVHAITAAAAVGLSDASTNAEGTSNFFSRADHTHAVTGFATSAHTHTESDITDLGSYPDSTGQLATKVPQTDGAGGWTFIDTPTGGGGGHPHVNTVEISDGSTVQWEIDLEVDGTLSFNFVG